MSEVVILGSGMAGLGANHQFRTEGVTPILYDKNSYYGGHTASFRYDSGFLFDVGPHISFTKDTRIQDLLADGVDQQYETIQINLKNYWRGFWPQHPVQLHMHGLPEDVIVKVITDFVAMQQAPEKPVSNYEEWLLASFGRTFAELFPMQYTRKYHLTTADNMSTDWLGHVSTAPVWRKCFAAHSHQMPRKFITSPISVTRPMADSYPISRNLSHWIHCDSIMNWYPWIQLKNFLDSPTAKWFTTMSWFHRCRFRTLFL